MRSRFDLMILLLTTGLALMGCRPTVTVDHTSSGVPLATPPGVAPAPPPLVVFAGAASKPALQELAVTYQQRRGVKVDVTFGGSGAVLTQFSQEQFGDLYIPGSDDFMDKAEVKDAVLKDSRKPLAYLVPMLSVAKGNPKRVKGLADLARTDLRVVLGETKSVCLGAIAQQALQDEGIWDRVSPHVASYASSCEAVLQSLLLGEADVVLGWDVFARQHPDRVESIPLDNPNIHPRNIPAAVIRWSKQTDAASAFIEYLTSPEARAVWQRHGYTVQVPK